MSPKWIIAIVASFVALTFIAALVEHTYATTGATSYLDTLMTFPNLLSLNAFSEVTNYFRAFWGAIIFDYPSIFTGGWIYVRYGLMALGIGVGFTLVITVLQLIRG